MTIEFRPNIVDVGVDKQEQVQFLPDDNHATKLGKHRLTTTPKSNCVLATIIGEPAIIEDEVRVPKTHLTLIPNEPVDTSIGQLTWKPYSVDSSY